MATLIHTKNLVNPTFDSVEGVLTDESICFKVRYWEVENQFYMAGGMKKGFRLSFGGSEVYDIVINDRLYPGLFEELKKFFIEEMNVKF